MTKVLPDHFDARVSKQGEDLARLLGVMRMLALPPVRTSSGTLRKRVVEILVAPETWARVDGMWIESVRIVFFAGPSEARTEYVFVEAEKVPAWRVDEDYRGPRIIMEAT